MTDPRLKLVYFWERKPNRVFVEDIFRDPTQELLITGPIPDLEGYQHRRETVQKNRHTVDPELRQFYQEPLLKKDQEQHLFRQLNFYKFRLVRALDPCAVIDHDKGLITYSVLQIRESETIQRYYDLAAGVKQQLSCCNARLVMSIAKKQREYWNSTSPDVLTEIVGEGNIGLLRAVDYFDFRRGFKFSTYATWAVRETIMRCNKARKKHEQTMTGCDVFEAIPDLSESPTEGDYDSIVKQALAKINGRQKRVLVEYFQRSRTLKEIAQDLHISKERVRQIRDKGLAAVRDRLAKLNYAP